MVIEDQVTVAEIEAAEEAAAKIAALQKQVGSLTAKLDTVIDRSFRAGHDAGFASAIEIVRLARSSADPKGRSPQVAAVLTVGLGVLDALIDLLEAAAAHQEKVQGGKKP